jgi:hypothetical protein
MAAVAEDVGRIPGARHVDLNIGASGGRALVTADLRADAADVALEHLTRLGVPADDVALVRLDAIGPTSDEPIAVVWADVLGQAQARARLRVRYVIRISLTVQGARS